MLDIGAHIGLVSLPLSTVVATDGTVYAFEPATGNNAYLFQHLAMNKISNVEVVSNLVAPNHSTGSTSSKASMTRA